MNPHQSIFSVWIKILFLSGLTSGYSWIFFLIPALAGLLSRWILIRLVLDQIPGRTGLASKVQSFFFTVWTGWHKFYLPLTGIWYSQVIQTWENPTRHKRWKEKSTIYHNYHSLSNGTLKTTFTSRMGSAEGRMSSSSSTPQGVSFSVRTLFQLPDGS